MVFPPLRSSVVDCDDEKVVPASPGTNFIDLTDTDDESVFGVMDIETDESLSSLETPHGPRIRGHYKPPRYPPGPPPEPHL